MTLFDYFTVFLLGLLGSGHCVGMCGGFALGIGGQGRALGPLALRHLLYQSGKALTYLFLAVLVATGTGLVGGSSWFHHVQIVVTVLVGVLMLFIGLSQLFEWRGTGWWKRIIEPFPLCGVMSQLFAVRSLWSAFAVGWLNGFLPCGLLIGALLYLASFHSVTDAAIGAIFFGAGTFPALFFLGVTARRWNPNRRRRLVQATGLLLALFGVLTMVRGVPAVHHWFHAHLVIPAGHFLIDWCGYK